MTKIDVVINNKSGLHARPASLFVKEVNQYKSDITVIKEGQSYNGKSIMSVLSMGIPQGQYVTIMAEGEDEKEAIEAIKKLVDNNFGE
ncbi:MAG: HPr family phosphocarrier protein [Clostridia bacterium]|nr:HPr family phosphocarrier protein [Clostridia bacterium]